MNEPAQRTRMSRVDRAWLRMDGPRNLMMIVGVWLLEPAVGYETLCERVAERFLKYPRFRQKVVPGLLGAQWVDDEDFDIHQHIVRESLPRRRGQSARQAIEKWLAGKTRKQLEKLALAKDIPLETLPKD